MVQSKEKQYASKEVFTNGNQGTVIEMKVTTPEGKSLVASIRLTEADMELFRQAADSVKNN